MPITIEYNMYKTLSPAKVPPVPVPKVTASTFPSVNKHMNI